MAEAKILPGLSTEVGLSGQYRTTVFPSVPTDLHTYPRVLQELWSTCNGCRIDEDIHFGQWGLVILDPEQSHQQTIHFHECRPDDALPNDIVVGTFLGDEDLLIYCASNANEGDFRIALPLDARSDWYHLGINLAEILNNFAQLPGSKYWEQ